MYIRTPVNNHPSRTWSCQTVSIRFHFCIIYRKCTCRNHAYIKGSRCVFTFFNCHLCWRRSYIYEVFCIRCTVNYIIGFTLNIYDSCIFHIDKRIRITECNITFNGNIHRLCRIDHDFTSIRPRLDLVIAAFGDGRAFKRDRCGCGIFLRSYAIFRRTPPEQVHWPEGQMSSCMPQALHWWTASSVFSSSKPLLSVKFLRLMSRIFSIAPLFDVYNLHLHWNSPCNFF